MIDTYQAYCIACNASFTVTYGRKTDTIVLEIYSCSFCRNLFSLENTVELKCPNCGNQKLVIYNMHKKENITYYQKMLEEGFLNKDQYLQLTSYWNTIRNHTCPVCGKQTLRWRLHQNKS
ncbi:MAG: hypothetical protein QXX20_05775 [Candidatus Thermoplasmatota archaeon]